VSRDSDSSPTVIEDIQESGGQSTKGEQRLIRLVHWDHVLEADWLRSGSADCQKKLMSWSYNSIIQQKDTDEHHVSL